MSEDLLINKKFLSFQKKINDEHKFIEDISPICSKIYSLSIRLISNLRIVIYEVLNLPRELRLLEWFLIKSEAAYAELKERIPKNDYYKFHSLWSLSTRYHCTCIALITWLKTRKLASPETVAEVLGISADEEQGFHLDLNDYLLGLIDMCIELASVAQTSAIYDERNNWPLQILKVVMEVDVGIRMLEVEHDPLKEESEELNYSIKKIKKIVIHILTESFETKRRNREPGTEELSLLCSLIISNVDFNK